MYYDFAIANIKGGPLKKDIRGYVSLKKVEGGVIVCAHVYGLPKYKKGNNKKDPIGPFGFHIHEGETCAIGDKNDPFKDAKGHFNPKKVPHGNHAGDFPVLIAHDGFAGMCFFTNKFNIDEVIGKAIIIHENPDDYRSQPAGDAGKRLACGIIKPMYNKMNW